MTKSITPEISPILIQSVSSIYTDVHRVIMEFVDNSLDSAEMNKPTLVQEPSEFNIDYERPFEITVIISGDSCLSGSIEINDNCSGIESLEEIFKNIGNSIKKDELRTNGQFGYGIHSFLAACDNLEIITKTKDHPAEYVSINRDEFLKPKLSDIKFEIVSYKQTFPYQSGTIVTLSKFFDYRWEDLKPEKIREEIERHFELLLRRKNLKVEIVTPKSSIICKPFDYDSIEGEVYETEVDIEKWSEHLKRMILLGKVKIFLKFTKGKSLNRPPILTARGRRIAVLTEIKSYDTHHKKDIWKHPNITGYIETGVMLNVTIDRTRIKTDDANKFLFKAIRCKEEEIAEFIKRNVSQSISDNFGIIEEKFNKVFEKLSLEQGTDEVEPKPGDKVILSDSENDPRFKCKVYKKAGTKKGKSRGKSKSNKNKSKIKPEVSGTIPHQITSPVEKISSPESKINIKIDSESEPLKDEDDKPKRSELFDNTVVIYKKHPDFKERLLIDLRTSEEIISNRLITYIITEVMLHFTTVHGLELERMTKKHLQNIFADNFYMLETELSKLDGEKLTKIS